MLKLKFRRLHTTVVDSVNPASIIGFLCQQTVIGADDMVALRGMRDDPKQQCAEMLTLLNRSKNPEAFVKLYAAISKERPQLQWLVDEIDKFSDQSLINLLQQQRYTNEPAGNDVFS